MLCEEVYEAGDGGGDVVVAATVGGGASTVGVDDVTLVDGVVGKGAEQVEAWCGLGEVEASLSEVVAGEGDDV